MCEKKLRCISFKCPCRLFRESATPGEAGRLSLVLLSWEAGVLHVVFQERAAGIAQPGEIGFPGGKVEPALDHTPEDTALRETEEELGLPRSAVSVLGRLDSLLTPSRRLDRRSCGYDRSTGFQNASES